MKYKILFVAVALMFVLVGCKDNQKISNVDTLQIYEISYKAEQQFRKILVELDDNCRLMSSNYFISDIVKVKEYYDGCVADFKVLDNYIKELSQLAQNAENNDITIFWNKEDRTQLLNISSEFLDIIDVYYSLNSKNQNISKLSDNDLKEIEKYTYDDIGITEKLDLPWKDKVKYYNEEYSGYSIYGIGMEISKIEELESEFYKICKTEKGTDECKKVREES